MAPRTDEGWGLAKNLGPKVNSEFNERGPSMNPACDKLYFSSNRPKVEVTPGERRRFWEALTQGKVRDDYDIFVVDELYLTKHDNPLRDRKYRKDIIAHLGGSSQSHFAGHQSRHNTSR